MKQERLEHYLRYLQYLREGVLVIKMEKLCEGILFCVTQTIST